MVFFCVCVCYAWNLVSSKCWLLLFRLGCYKLFLQEFCSSGEYCLFIFWFEKALPKKLVVLWVIFINHLVKSWTSLETWILQGTKRKLAQVGGEVAFGRFYGKVLNCSKGPLLIFPIYLLPFSPFLSHSLFLF